MTDRENQLAQQTARGWHYFNSRDIDAFVKGLADDYVWNTDIFPRPIEGPAATAQGLRSFFSVFPDIQFGLDEVFAHENASIVRFYGRGTRTNGFLGFPPTAGRPFLYRGCAINRFNERGRRAATWVFFDSYSILRQIGTLSSPAGALPPAVPGQAPAGASAATAGAAGEEVIVRYGVGKGAVLDDPRFITLHVDLFEPGGRRVGHYEGIQQAAAAPDPRLLTARPPMPPEPIDRPGGIPSLPVGGNYKATWWMSDRDSLTAVGPSIASLVPLRDGSFLFSTTAMGVITGGTGRYEGARGVKSAVGSGLLPSGMRLAAGTSFDVKTVDVFRVVTRDQVLGPSSPLPDPTTGAVPSPALPAGGPGPSFPLPPTFPPGADLTTYRIDAVTRLLKRAAYLPIFSVHDPRSANVPISSPTNPSRLIGVEVNEELHRFHIDVAAPTFEPPPGLRRMRENDKRDRDCVRICDDSLPVWGMRARKRVGEAVATVHIRWMVAPDDFVPAPGKVPPPTELDPTRPQRFVTLDGEMRFKDRRHSGFRGFGAGRTFPAMVGQQPQLRLGAVIDVLEGLGSFQGLSGTVSVNGYITPPQELALNFIVRFMDPAGKLRTASSLAPIRAMTDPDPDTAFLVFLGEPDPERPTTLQGAPGGPVRASVRELLRLVDLNFDLKGSGGVRSRTRAGAVVGSLTGTLLFNPADPGPCLPIQTTDGLFTFWDHDRQTVATLRANVVEGRAFRTPLAGAPMSVFRFGGFGPFLGGTGPFRDAVGMMSLNAAISVFPRTLSNLYVLRVSDPDGRFRSDCARAWLKPAREVP